MTEQDFAVTADAAEQADQDVTTEDESGAADDGEFDRAAADDEQAAEVSEDSTGVEL